MSDLKPPSRALLAAEARVFLEWPTFGARQLLLRDLPAGDGHAVIIVPGFGASDAVTRPMRRALDRLGYTSYGWGLGRNLGMRRSVGHGLATLVEEANAAHGPVSLVGWSLGGIFVRELARRHPEQVRRVFSLGSPIADPHANNIEALFHWVNRTRPASVDREAFERRRTPPPVPCVAIYSKTDGIIAWPSALEIDAPNTENVEVHGSHVGMCFNPEVLRAIATRLPLS